MSSELIFFIKNTYKQAYDIKKHSHPCYELVYYFNARGQTSIGEKTYEFTNNTFVISQPNEIHDERSDSRADLMFIGFTTDHTLASGLYHDEQREIQQTLKEIHKEMEEKNPLYQSILNILTEKLVFQILRIYTKREKGASNFDYILNYVHTVANRNISVQQIALDLGYNYNYLRSLFLRQTGQTIKSYLQNLKIINVKNYLLDSDYTLGKIAEITGFNSASHLCAVFKKITGNTPLEWKATAVYNPRRDNMKKNV